MTFKGQCTMIAVGETIHDNCETGNNDGQSIRQNNHEHNDGFHYNHKYTKSSSNNINHVHFIK